MNLYKSLLLSAIVVTSFGAAFAGEDVTSSAPAAEPVVATANFFARNKEVITKAVSEFAQNRTNEVVAEYTKLRNSKSAKEIATNKLVISGAVATLAAVGAGVWTYFFRKPQEEKTLVPVASQDEQQVLPNVNVQR